MESGCAWRRSADHCSLSVASLKQLLSDVSPDYFKLKALGGHVGKSQNDNPVGEEKKKKNNLHTFFGVLALLGRTAGLVSEEYYGALVHFE